MVDSPEPINVPTVDSLQPMADTQGHDTSDSQPTEALRAVTEMVEGHTESVSTQADDKTGLKDKQTNELVFMAAVESGAYVKQAAQACGLSERTAYRVLSRMEVDADSARDAIRKLMVVRGLEAMDNWRTAMDVGARKKGNHAPARDWLLHAGVIDPLVSDDRSRVNISINIGTDTQPMRIVSPQALDPIDVM